MRFHQRALEWCDGPDISLDPDRGALVRRVAEGAGIHLPAALVDWYCVPEASTLWSWFLASDHLAVRFHAGERQSWMAAAEAEGDSLIEDGQLRGWWWVPRPREDVRGLFRAPILPVVYETQGCCWWGVPLDGSDDPPVVVCLGDQGDQWDYYTSSFSDFVLARVFDGSISSGETKRTVNVEADVSGEQLRALRRQFRPEATTREGGDWFAHRFSGEGQRFRLQVLGHDTRSSGYSIWQLWAIHPDRFRALVEMVSGVYARLQGVTPDRQSPLYLRGEMTTADDERQGADFTF